MKYPSCFSRFSRFSHLLCMKSWKISSRTSLLDAEANVGIKSGKISSCLRIPDVSVIVGIIFCLIPILFAQDSGETDRKISYFIFNSQDEAADSLINKQIRIYPENLKYYFLRIQNNFYSCYFKTFGTFPDSLIERVHESAEQAIELGERKEMTAENMFYLGSAYGYLARYYVIKSAYWDAFWAARHARRCLGQILENDSSFADARQELAVQSYFTSRLNGFLAFLTWLTGMRGKAAQALEQLQVVADQGHLCKNEARFVLLNLYYNGNDHTRALQLGKTLLADFPDNTFLRVQTMLYEVVFDHTDLDFLVSEFDSLKSKYHMTDPAILNTLGYFLMGHRHFEDAFKAFHINIRLFPGVANGYDSLSEAYLITGNVQMAIHYSKLCLEKLPFDTTITDAERNNLQSISEKRLEDLGVDTGKKMI